MRVFVPKNLCWRPDIPDFRDLVPESPQILNLLPDGMPPNAELPSEVNLSSCLLSHALLPTAACPTSIVCTKLVEYFDYRCSGRIEPRNVDFVTRTVTTRERGSVRANLKAIRQFGIPSIHVSDIHCDTGELHSNLACPNLACQGNSDEFRSMRYFRLGNSISTSPVAMMKLWLAHGFPIVFGFSVPSSLDCDGYIDYRPTFDSIHGGHAAMLVGYDDKQLAASRGAFHVYCPWGNEWGEQGFGWLPYTFVEHRAALDFWTIIKPEWVKSGELFRTE